MLPANSEHADERAGRSKGAANIFKYLLKHVLILIQEVQA
jgi:hypothetical protein